ncbi:MAG: type I 3-dehydroquinate dehydratase [bacterium]|nr:type I 3-dehydroquinate dehydratase [bacterium]
MITCVPPKLVGVAAARTLAADLAAIAACPPDLVEYRADLAELVTTDTLTQDLCALRTSTGRPLICTLRDVKEGGECRLPLEQRALFLRIALPLVDAVDIELANLPLLALLHDDLVRHATTCILSWHDFTATPPDARLHELLAVARAAPAPAGVIVKFATHCASAADAVRLLALPQAAPEMQLAVVGMGPYGRAVRMVAPAFGAVLGYAALAHAVAPGQLSVADTRAAWRLLEPPA